jgi:GntR family transcriptional repressor for pyruvate dehydrogenase complex
MVTMTQRPPAGRSGAAPDPPFPSVEAIRRPRLCDEVARQLQELIQAGRLKPGDRLPPERDLVRRFQVSRGSVRDALRMLEVVGLVRSRQGEGTVVQELSADSLVTPLSAALVPKRELLAELLELRRIVEPAFAARAAARATPQAIASMEDVLRRQRERSRRHESTIEEDSEFHYLVATASGNAVVNRVVDLLMDLMRESRARSLQVDGRLERSLEGHTRILRAIRRRSPKAAEKAMRRHLVEIERLLLGGVPAAPGS